MRGVLRKEKTYSDRWNETLNCNLTEEFKAYRYLCEDMERHERKRYEKKAEIKFQKYSQWESHIREQLKVLPNNEAKKEFEKFLSHKSRIANSSNTVSLNYIFPLLTACVGAYMNDFFQIIFHEHNLITLVLGIIIFLGSLVWLMHMVYTQTRYMDSKKAFFEDLLEILKNMDNKEG